MSNYTQVLPADEPSLQQAIQKQGKKAVGTQLLKQNQMQGYEVLLLIDDQIEHLKITPGLEYQLGRFEDPDDYQISLNNYRPMERGISRLHASLFVRDKQLYIVDHASTNGTYVAGERLRPDLPAILTRGRDILLGRLRVQVIFH